MEVKNKAQRFADMMYQKPFRAIEFIFSVPLVIYGLYLCTGYNKYSIGYDILFGKDGEVNSQISGGLFILAGVALFLGAKSQVTRSRRLGTMVLFIAMLHALLFRGVEGVLTPTGGLMFFFGCLVASADYLYLTGRDGPVDE